MVNSMRSKKQEEFITEKQLRILLKLYEASKEVNVRSINKSQGKLASELGITRQALSIHLRKLREKGIIRTGRGFIDITEKALKILEETVNESFVMIKVQPQRRDHVYEQIIRMPYLKSVYRVTGEIDIIAIVNQSVLDKFLMEVSKIDGVVDTSAHVVIAKLK